MKVLLHSGVLLTSLSLLASGCLSQEQHSHGSHGHDERTEEMAKGPHGGRLLEDGRFSLEVTIFERRVPPEFRLYAYNNGKPVAPRDVEASIRLKRFGGVTDDITFSVVGDYLRGNQEIYEPHSFDVMVSATYDGKSYQWTYESYEGRTQLSAEAVKLTGIEVASAGPKTISTGVELRGRVALNEERYQRITPRFAGVVRQATKQLGDPVTKDEVLAVIESNESLQRFEVRSGISGTVVSKDVIAGEYVSEGSSIYRVADLGSVWIDLTVHRGDYAQLRVGQAATIRSLDGSHSASGRLIYLSPVAAEGAQAMLARVEIPNAEGAWQPGIFVLGQITTEQSEVSVAVRKEAIQTFRDWEVVFLKDGDLFEIAILELGRRDDEWVEVLAGLKPGQTYVSHNSFIIKADIGKSGASHDH